MRTMALAFCSSTRHILDSLVLEQPAAAGVTSSAAFLQLRLGSLWLHFAPVTSANSCLASLYHLSRAVFVSLPMRACTSS